VRALICRAFGPLESLSVDEVPDPKPLAGQVVVGVRACGVNFPDVLVVEGKYQFKPTPPFSPGGEAAGVVEAVGPGVTGVAVGDRVVAIAPWGGMAEKVAADTSQIVKIPDVLSAHGTTLYALRDRAKLRDGETLLVLGAAGGLGLAAVQIGKRMGARVIAAASTPEKLATCLAHGADLTVNYTREDLKARVKELTNGAGADVVFDPVGGQLTEAAVRATAWGGRLLVLGFTTGEIPRLPLNLVLLKSCSIVGVFWGMWVMREPERAMGVMSEVLAGAKDGTLAPHVSLKVPLDRALDALQTVAGRRIQGKAVVVMGGEA
jgi:NADPH2:quinone reductase